MKNILIIGLGEIGNAIKQIEEEAGNKVYECDMDREASNEIEFDVCHICIPFTDKFVNIITDYIKKFNIKLNIIHSTITPHTIQQIKDNVDTMIVHSPCMGIHPHLYEGIKTFTKIISGSENECDLAHKHFSDININSQIYSTPNASELAKLLDTTYYAWNILFAKYAQELCDKFKVNYDEVYTITNYIYNEGYTKLGKNNVIRPILYPPHKSGLGGHCCIENAILLHEMDNKNNIIKNILSMGKDSHLKYKDRTWLYCEYIGKDKSIKEIAEECNTDSETIVKYLDKFGL